MSNRAVPLYLLEAQKPYLISWFANYIFLNDCGY